MFSVLVCATCKGEGEVDCPKCRGTGLIPTNCDECKGKGKLTTETGTIECDICDGRGIVDIKCNECFGGGKIACEACGGTGGTEDPLAGI